MKKKLIIDPIYGCDFLLVVCPLEEMSAFFIRKYGEGFPKGSPSASFVTIEDTDKGEVNLYLWLSEFNGSVEDMGTLSHEVVHLVASNFRFINLVIDEHSEEAQAYYFQMVFQNCLEYLKSLHLTKRK